MKKNYLLIIFSIFILFTGCFSNKDQVGSFIKKVKNSKKYYLSGTLEIVNGEDLYTYNIKVSYKKPDYYKVDLINKMNNHEQIILRNNNGVYVITPSLNKSFKFQSDWPYNNSQSYLLQSLIQDIDNKKKIVSIKDETIVITKANYENNPKLISEKIFFKKSLPTKVEVYDKDANVKIRMKFKNIDLNPKFDNNYFEVKTSNSKIEKTSKQLEDIVYPMNIPKNTYLAHEDKLNNGQRVILTFLGEKPFTVVEQTAKVSEKLETINVNGEPELLLDTVGVFNDNEATWISKGTEYYATSDKLNSDELVEVINSINTVPVSK